MPNYTFFRMKYLLPVLLALCACTPTPITPSPADYQRGSAADKALMAEMPDSLTMANHLPVMLRLLGDNQPTVRHIGILVYEGVNDLDVMGPRYVLGQAMGATTRLIAIEPGNVRTVMGVELVPDTVIDSVDQLDILVVPGGFRGTIAAAYDERLHDWIRRIDAGTTYTAGVCTGAWILGGAGLLAGKRATTNWYRAEEMLTKYGATFTDERYTRDGKLWTSAGVTAGMDMSLALLAELYGERYAQGIMLDMEYDPAPPLEGGSPERTGEAVEWMMRGMYDAGVLPAIAAAEAGR